MLPSIEKPSPQEIEEYRQDLLEELIRYGEVLQCCFIAQQIGFLRPGDALALFAEEKGARQAREKVDGRLFDGRILSAYFYP